MHVSILSEKLCQRGHKVIALCAPSSELEKDLKRRSINVFPFSPWGYMDFSAIIKIKSILSKTHPDIIHAHYSKDLWAIAPAKHSSIPLIFVKHIGTQKPKLDAIHRWIYSRVNHTIAISKVIEKNLLETHPIPQEKICVVHHGVDLLQYDRHFENRKSVRQEFGIKDDEILIGNIGRLQEGKGHLEFLDMAKKLSDRHKNIKFLIVGEPTRGEEFRAQVILQKAKVLELQEQVIFTGFRTDIPHILSAMDIFVFPSRAEAFGLVIIEAMAAGLPVISSNCDGVLDIIEQQKNGILANPLDIDELVRSVEMLMTNRDLRQRLAHAGRKTVEQRFSLDSMADKIENIYYKNITTST